MSKSGQKLIALSADTLAQVNAMRNGNSMFAGPRNDVSLSEVQTVIDTIGESFKEFKAHHQKQLNDINVGLDELHTKYAGGRLGGSAWSWDGQMDERKALEEFGAYLRNPIRAAMSTDSNPDGGYTVQPQVDSTISRLATENGVIRKIAGNVTIEPGKGNSYIRIVNVGGTDSGWVGEREARPSTANAKLAEIEIPVRELYAFPKTTQNLLDDSSVQVAQMMTDDIGIEFTSREDDAFVRGDGVKQPRGFTTYAMVADASWAWGKLGFVKTGVANALSDSTYNGADALIDLTHALKTAYLPNAVFVMNRNTAAIVRKLKDGDKNYLWQSSIQQGQPSTLLGYPVYLDPSVDDIGADKFPIWFGDFRRGYTIVDKHGVRVLPDPYTQRPYVGFYATRRVGGGVTNFEAIKALKIAA